MIPRLISIQYFNATLLVNNPVYIWVLFFFFFFGRKWSKGSSLCPTSCEWESCAIGKKLKGKTANGEQTYFFIFLFYLFYDLKFLAPCIVLSII